MTKARATLVGFAAIVMWSLLALLGTLAGPIPPFQLTAMAFLIGTLSGMASWPFRSGVAQSLRQPWPVWVVGTVGLCLYHCLYFFAIQNAPPLEASLIAYLWPLLIVVFGALLPGEKLKLQHVAGAVMGLAGAALIITRGGNVSFAAGLKAGHGLALACAFVWAFYSLAARQFKGVSSDVVTGFCALTAIVAFGLHLALEPTVWPASVSAWLALAVLGLFPLGLGFYAWDVGCKKGDILALGALSYAAPLLSTAVLLVSGLSSFHWSVVPACLLITAGGVIAAKDLIFKKSI